MALTLPNAEQWVASCQADGEFALAACYWSGGLRLRIGERTLAFTADYLLPVLDCIREQ